MARDGWRDMALTADVKMVRYGSADGHQPLAKQLPSGVTVYRGSVAGLAGTGGGQGKLKNESTVAATDIVLGMIVGAGSGTPNTTVGVVGPVSIVDIATGSFVLASGTGADALDVTTNGATVYLIDEVTVGKTSGGSSRPVAGVQLACNADDSSIPSGFVAVKVGTPNSPLGGP
jgi:hypothetical protein